MFDPLGKIHCFISIYLCSILQCTKEKKSETQEEKVVLKQETGYWKGKMIWTKTSVTIKIEKSNGYHNAAFNNEICPYCIVCF